MSREDVGGPLQRGVASTMDEREKFEAHFGIPVEQRRAQSAGGYAMREYQMMWAGWQAARRITPDGEFDFTDGVSSHTVYGDKKAIDALLRWKMNQQRITEKALSRTTPDRGAWISVDERLPETAHFVLAVNKMAAVKCVQYYHGEWIGMGGVTHWMPLPAAPTSDKGGA